MPRSTSTSRLVCTSLGMLAAPLLALSACVSSPVEPSTTGPSASATEQPAPTAAVPASTASAETPRRASVPLEARPHVAEMTEVVLSPDGRAAVTLDSDGGVRLWPSFEDSAIPWTLPLSEPLWMSVARDEAGSGFVVAVVDTGGAAHVGHVEISGDEARWVTAFDTPPMDPLFEVHVMGGGKRLLALGVDHRVRLWDTDGNVLAQLDERGVVPWQLRVQHDADGKPHAAVIQFAPVRIQALEISDSDLNSGLELRGDAQPLAIDQSPNRNDIGMSPDGRYATAMQKPSARSPRFEIEIVNLHDGSRRLWVAESDTGFRPRVHPLEDEILAETGSGKALRLPLDAATPWQPGGDRASLAPQPAAAVTLGGSNEDSMTHATMRAGVYAVARNQRLHVQQADAPPGSGTTMGHERFSPSAVGLSPSGDQVAWASSAGIVVESTAGDHAPRTLAPTSAPANFLAFLGDEQLVTMDDKGHVELRDLATDTVVDVTSLNVGWAAEHTGWRASETGGDIVLSSTQPSAPLQVLSVTPKAFGKLTQVPLGRRSAWPEGGKPPRADSDAWLASQGFDRRALDLEPSYVVATVPGPAGARTAVHQRGALTMVDNTAAKRLWARPAWRVQDVAWSADGSLLAIADSSGGHVFDAATGAVVYDRVALPRLAEADDGSR